jgi:hypothetical protein
MTARLGPPPAPAQEPAVCRNAGQLAARGDQILANRRTALRWSWPNLGCTIARRQCLQIVRLLNSCAATLVEFRANLRLCKKKSR